MSVLQKMTESLFEETLKRIASDLWKERFADLYREGLGRYDIQNIIKAECAKLAAQILAENQGLRDKLKEAVAQEIDICCTPARKERG